MKKDKWLNSIIFEAKLYENTSLSEFEKYCIVSYIKEDKTLNQIGNDLEMSNERVRQLIENGFGKILLRTKELVVKNYWLQKTLIEKDKLENELNLLKKKYSNELDSEKQISIEFHEDDISLKNIPFTVRAKKVLDELNINNINELSVLTKERLLSLDRTGVKTVEEIIRRAEEFGIKIT